MIILNTLTQVLLFMLAVTGIFGTLGLTVMDALRVKLTPVANLFFALVTGIVTFLYLAYAFSWIHAEILLLPIITLAAYRVMKKRLWRIIIVSSSDVPSLAYCIAMAGIFSLPMIASGYWVNGLRLTGVNAHDGLWYLALIRELQYHFPPEHPGFSGVPFSGYHFFYFFLVAKISQYFRLDLYWSFLRFFPALTAFLWSTGVYELMRLWTDGNKKAAAWSVFLTMFGGSFVYLWRTTKESMTLSPDSGFGISQPAQSLLNPPFAFSVVLIVLISITILMYRKTKIRGYLVLLASATGSIAAIKVYGAIVVFPALAVLAFVDAARKKPAYMVSLLFGGLLTLVTYWIFTDRSAHLLWAPFWAPHKVMIDNFPWYGYEEKMYTFTQQSVIRGLVETEAYTFFIFFIGNMGTRVLGVLALAGIYVLSKARSKNKERKFSAFMLLMTIVSITVPLLFMQTGKVFETIQLGWYFLFFISLYAGWGIAFVLERIPRKLSIIIAFVFILATVPSTFDIFSGTVIRPHGKLFPYTETSPYQALSRLPGGYDATTMEIPDMTGNPIEEHVEGYYRAGEPTIPALGEKRAYLQNEYFDFPGVNPKSRYPLTFGLWKLASSAEEETAGTLSLSLAKKARAAGIRYILIPSHLRLGRFKEYTVRFSGGGRDILEITVD